MLFALNGLYRTFNAHYMHKTLECVYINLVKCNCIESSATIYQVNRTLYISREQERRYKFFKEKTRF